MKFIIEKQEIEQLKTIRKNSTDHETRIIAEVIILFERGFKPKEIIEMCTISYSQFLNSFTQYKRLKQH